MATSLCSALALAALLQAPPGSPLAGAPQVESLAALRARVVRDSADGRAWLLLGRAYLRLVDGAHGPPDRALQDSAWARAALDTAEGALARAAGLLDAGGPTPQSDSARVLRVGAWSARARLAWEERGTAAGPQEWGPVPLDLKLPPVLDELGENLLRVCPMWGVLFTAGEADWYAAWYMRFARGLRPDLLVMPLAAWRSDSALRAWVAADLKLGRRRDGDGELAEVARHRPVCISMGFERAPEARPRIKWAARPLLWVGGPEREGDRVPPRDFVFAALRMALDEHDAWADPALALYARAARATPALCEALATFKVANQVAPCRK
ncbi:MAG TPA: hypothetical protein VEK78_15975 [Gemmatimonadales bacterium]|nr:hypothetical protein [Gemmatimonadales bacterium]